MRVPAPLEVLAPLGGAVMLYLHYCARAGRTTGASWWSRARIAEALGVSEPTIHRWRGMLVAAGLVTVSERSRRTGADSASLVTVSGWTREVSMDVQGRCPTVDTPSELRSGELLSWDPSSSPDLRRTREAEEEEGHTTSDGTSPLTPSSPPRTRAAADPSGLDPARRPTATPQPAVAGPATTTERHHESRPIDHRPRPSGDGAGRHAVQAPADGPGGADAVRQAERSVSVWSAQPLVPLARGQLRDGGWAYVTDGAIEIPTRTPPTDAQRASLNRHGFHYDPSTRMWVAVDGPETREALYLHCPWMRPAAPAPEPRQVALALDGRGEVVAMPARVNPWANGIPDELPEEVWAQLC